MAAADRNPTIVADPRFRLGVGAYVGTLLAGTGSIAITLRGGSPTLIAATCGIALAIGIAAGFGSAGRVGDLAARIGRSRRRRVGLVAPATAFAAAALGPAASATDPRVGVVGFGSAVAVALVGWIVGTMARTRYVDAIIRTEPVVTVSWTPPGAARADLALLGLAIFLGLSSAYGGSWAAATLWTAIGALWAVSCVVEGRWRIEDGGHRPELRVHEAGLVKRRPYSQSFVPWAEVRHVRLRDGELVVDRGFFTVRFDDDQLDDPAAVLESIERTTAAPIIR